MTDNAFIFEQLRDNNPFLSSSSPLPFENNMPDVADLNSDVSAQIEQLVIRKRNDPSLPLAGLVFGTAGIGKTHMLARILRRLRKNSGHAVFVSVRAFTNPKRVMQELLSEILLCLDKPHLNNSSQFDMLLGEMMNVYHERRRTEGQDDDPSRMKAFLRRDMQSIDKNFLKCILLYLGTDDIDTRINIIDWLREGLDEEDSDSLGLPKREVYSMEDAACEGEAKKIIESLGIVLSYARIPMMLCFDELDSIKDNSLIEAWGDAVGFVMNSVSAIIPLCFVKEETWENFKPVINLSIIQRLRLNTLLMRGACSLKQAQNLIRDRIASVFPDSAEEKYSWLMARMSKVLKPGFSPRMVIELARKSITDTGDQSDPIREAFDEEFKKVQAVPRAWPPNSDYMALAASVWLNVHDGCSVEGTRENYLKLFGVLGDRHIAFAMPVPKKAPTAAAAADRCLKFIKEYPDGFCCYVMEKKVHKPTWKAFDKKLDEFVKAGGHVIELDKESRVKWYALAALISRIRNGDVNIYSGSGTRPANLDDARAFLRSIDLIPGLFGENRTPAPREQGKIIVVEPDVLKVNLLSILKTAPMKLATADKALSLLANRRIHLDRNELLAFVREHKDLFRVFISKENESIISLATHQR